ncbi:MAG: hypothetical protein JXA53_07465, partial [Bacteroidales bacterium]|nr:hypothetical protein [Bacteroidales bacterium]
MKKIIISFLCYFIVNILSYGSSDEIKGYKENVEISSCISVNAKLYATKTIVFKPGFSIPKGTSFSASITSKDNTPNINRTKSYDIVYSATSPEKKLANLGTIADNAIVSVNYYDSFGNVEQSQVLNASPDGRDLVSFSEFKPGATTQKSFLGFAANTQGAFMDNPEAALKAFYSNPNDDIADDSRPWAETTVEDSPLNRVVNSTNVGEGMDAHKQLSDYSFNVAGQVPMWSLVGDVWKFAGYYPANTHFVQLVTDENGKQATIITNSMGQKVVSKSGNVENWYVYDDLGRLVHTIPSSAINVIKKSVGYELKLDNPIVKEFVYTYKYADNISNVVEKYLPGVNGSVEYVYDKLGRIVLSRNVKLKSENKWSFIKYDKFGRVIQTGIFTAKNGVTRQSLQTILLKKETPLNELVQQAGEALTTSDPMLIAIRSYYSEIAFPSTSFSTVVASVQIDAYNFYDKYFMPGMDYIVKDDYTEAFKNPVGQLTCKAVRVEGGVNDGKYRTSAFYYSNKGELVSTVSSSIFDQAKLNRTYIKYDFTGKAEKSLSLYNRKLANGGFALMEISQYHTYDRMGRLLTVDQQIAGDVNGRITMAKYEYNALGQLKAKNLHKKANGTFLQTVDYAYNIRGQLTDINNVNDKNSDDVFAMHINYNKQLDNAQANAKSLWNGFISSVEWRNHGQADKRAYSLEYDDNYRLTAAKYSEGDNRNINVGKYNMSAAYDNMGNITNLTRNGGDNGQLIDNITYTYKDVAGKATNKLSSVTDNADVSLNGQYGFGKPNAQFVYDDLGNLIKDTSRDVDTIVYNYRNLPIWILLTNKVEVSYTYDAEGTKLTR